LKNFRNIFSKDQIDRIIEMAWEDRTPFDAINKQFGINEEKVKYILRSSLKLKTYLVWRKRVVGRKTKHSSTSFSNRFKSKSQRFY
tara:strand:+ start:55 stop:312 length:258 start_codon:yes stop_codon:yes gene_type:complete